MKSDANLSTQYTVLKDKALPIISALHDTELDTYPKLSFFKKRKVFADTAKTYNDMAKSLNITFASMYQTNDEYNRLVRTNIKGLALENQSSDPHLTPFQNLMERSYALLCYLVFLKIEYFTGKSKLKHDAYLQNTSACLEAVKMIVKAVEEEKHSQ